MTHKRMWLFIVLLLAAFFLPSMPPVLAQEKSYSADRFDVDILVEQGGSLLVTETVVYRFVGGPFTYIFRELPTDLTDGITVLEGSIDGRTVSYGTQPGQLEQSGSDPVRLTWHFEPTSNTTRTVVLRYRVAGVVRQSASGDEMRWQALPDEYDFAIGSSSTTVRWPAGIAPLAEPAILAGNPQVSVSGNQARFTLQTLAANSPLVISLTYPAGSLISQPPAWQAAQQAARQTQARFAPFWIGGGAAILLVGLTWVLRQAPRTATRSDRRGVAYDPPGKMAPGLTGALLSIGSGTGWESALGTLFDLAEQGVLEIEESPEQKWYRKHEFIVRLRERPSTLLPHQEALLEMLFSNKQGQVKTIKLSELQNVVTSRRWKQYTETVKAELKAAHLFAEANQRRRNGLMSIGALLIFGGMASLLLMFTPATGSAFALVSGSLILVGLTAVIVGATILPLTPEAIQEAAAWQRFANYLRRVSQGKEVVDSPNMFIKYLPFAAAFGLLHSWSEHFAKEGWMEVPPYFKALPGHSPEDSMAAFVAMSAASSSSGGAAAGAGAAAAGAAGGGAAGAG